MSKRLIHPHRSSLSRMVPAVLLAAGLGAASQGLVPRPEALMPLFGEPSRTETREGDTLLDVAYFRGLGFESVVRLNPDVEVWIPEAGTPVELPTQMVLPSVDRDGLVINVPEMRLYDFTAPDGLRVLPVAIGEPDVPTPTGEFVIGRKRINPTWYVPASILRERPELPATVPPGPENPLGDRWMTLGRTSYGIHGTNNQWSIGHEATHGCIRMYNHHIHELFERTREGTRVRVVYQPVKLGRREGDIFVEAHLDIYRRNPDPVAAALVQLLALGLDPYVDRARVAETIQDARGVPVRVGRLPEDATSARPS